MCEISEIFYNNYQWDPIRVCARKIECSWMHLLKMLFRWINSVGCEKNTRTYLHTQNAGNFPSVWVLWGAPYIVLVLRGAPYIVWVPQRCTIYCAGPSEVHHILCWSLRGAPCIVLVPQSSAMEQTLKLFVIYFRTTVVLHYSELFAGLHN